MKRKYIHRAGLVCITGAVFAGTLLFGSTASYRYFNNKIYDTLFHARDAVFPVDRSGFPSVIVGIDRTTLEAYPEPVMFWDRELAGAVEAVSRAKAGAIGFDILHLASVESKRHNFGKMRLGEVLLSKPESVLPYAIDGDVIAFPVYVTRRYREMFGVSGILSTSAKLKLMALAERTKGVSFGFANLSYDEDGIVRETILYDYSAGTHVESFPLRIYMRYAVAVKSKKIVRSNTAVYAEDMKVPSMIRINYAGPPGSVPMVPLVELNAHLDDGEYLRKKFRGKVVIFGAYDPSMGDIHNTPYISSGAGKTRGMYGSEILANAVDTLARGRFISGTGSAAAAVISLVFVFLGILVSRRRIGNALAVFAIVLGLSSAVSFILFVSMDYVLSPLPCVGLSAGFFFGYLYSHYLLGRDRNLLQSTLKSYLDPAIVDRVISESGTEILKGRRREVTVMFADIRNFTTLSENKPSPEDVVGILNIYLPAMSSVIRSYEGCVDKFIGDGIMAFWNAPHDVDNHAEKAVHCAREMMRRLSDVNSEAISLGLIDENLAIGIGIHTGIAVVGNIGSEVKHDYTAIGDTVNTASRLEGKTKELGFPIVISEMVRAEIRRESGIRFDAAGTVQVKGKSKKIRVYGVRYNTV